MMVPSTTLFFIPFLLVHPTASARILGIFMIDAYSHFNVNNAIMETLAMGGHEVTVISTLKPKNPIANITYIQAEKEMPEDVFVWSTVGLKHMAWWQTNEVFQQIFEQDCDRFMALKESQDLLAGSLKFDVLFIELLPICQCYLSVAWRQQIPIIGTFSYDMRGLSTALFGNPYNPSIIPHFYSPYTSKMTFVERLMNAIETVYLEYVQYTTNTPVSRRFLQKYFPKGDLNVTTDISLVFINNHPSLFPLPYVPRFVQVGGIHLKPPQKLPKHLDEFIRGAEHGVILFSLGSVAASKDFAAEARQIFINVFAQLPQRIIWKHGERVDGVSDNVLISEWIPQQDVLAQENVLLFISHVGKSSTLEAIHSGTPILAVPLFTDQFSNSGNIRDLGVGKALDIDSLTEALLLSSIQEMLHNKSYKDKARKLAQTFQDRPMSAKQSVLYWTEYVLRHNGATHFHTTAADLPFYHYLLLDVILFAFIFSTLMLILTSYVMKKTYDLLLFYGKSEPKY